MTNRLLSLAAGVLIDVAPEDAVSAASAAGWPACGVWFDPETWSDAREREVARRLDDTGMSVLDVEAIIVGTDVDPTERLVGAAAALGSSFVLFTSRIGDRQEALRRFCRACDVAQATDPSLVVVYEFLPAFPLGTLADALWIVGEAARPNSGVLIDNLHLRSSGVAPADVARLDRSLFPYLQIADAPLPAPVGSVALLHEARHERRWPGDGNLPIDALLAALPQVPLSFEVRSASDREAFPDPVDRARYGWERVSHMVG